MITSGVTNPLFGARKSEPAFRPRGHVEIKTLGREHRRFLLQVTHAVLRYLKGDLAIRPIFHQHEKRIEAHIFIAFLAYCMQIAHSGEGDHAVRRMATTLSGR
jgi:hypothetical protein